MMKEKLEYYLGTIGFFPLTSKLSEVKVLVRFENNLANVLQIIDYTNDLYLDKEQYEEVKASLKGMFTEKGISDTHILSLVLAEDNSRSRRLSEGDPFCWHMDSLNMELVIEEDKQPDFYGLKGVLETFLKKYQEDPEQFQEPKGEEYKEPRFREKIGTFLKNAPYFTLLLVAANLILCFCCIADPKFFYGKGCLGLSYILQGEFYRLFTSMFLHGGLEHFFSNMLLLYFLGDMMENRIGRFRFMVLYLLTGFIGNMVSCLYEYLTNINYVTYGASGAVFGLIGMLFYLVVNRDPKTKVSLTAMIFMIIYSVYSSLVEVQVNVAAHLGGLLAGMLLMFVFYPRRKFHES